MKPKHVALIVAAKVLVTVLVFRYLKGIHP